MNGKESIGRRWAEAQQLTKSTTPQPNEAQQRLAAENAQREREDARKREAKQIADALNTLAPGIQASLASVGAQQYGSGNYRVNLQERTNFNVSESNSYGSVRVSVYGSNTAEDNVVPAQYRTLPTGKSGRSQAQEGRERISSAYVNGTKYEGVVVDISVENKGDQTFVRIGGKQINAKDTAAVQEAFDNQLIRTGITSKAHFVPKS